MGVGQSRPRFENVEPPVLEARKAFGRGRAHHPPTLNAHHTTDTDP